MIEPLTRVPTIETVFLENDYRKATAGLKGEFAARTHVDQTIDGEKLIITPDCKITALLLKQRINPKLCRAAYDICSTVDDSVEGRPSAAGSPSMPRLNKNGRIGLYRAIPEGVQAIFERDGIRKGSLGAKGGTAGRAPSMVPRTRRSDRILEKLRPVIEESDRLYFTYLPYSHEIQSAALKQAPEEFRLWKTAFSSVYIPKQWRTGYHRDSANLPGVMTVLMALGDFTGGELVFPRWRIAVALQPGDVLFFNPQELHGNLVIEGNRLSIALYCARNLSN